MPCFFVITGYCSNFNKSFSESIITSFKTIAFPGIIFSILFFLLERRFDVISLQNLIKEIFVYGGKYWFLPALFVAKLLYVIFFQCLSEHKIYYYCFLLFILGFILSKMSHKYELWWIYHAVIMIPYLGLGQYLKKKEYCFDDFYVLCPLFFVLFATTIVLAHYGILRIDYFYHVPGITQMFLNVNITMLFPLITLSTIGSVLIITISKLLSNNSFLEFFGKNSLTIYCVHGYVLGLVFSKLGVVISQESPIFIATICVVMGYIITMLIVSLLVFFINQTYLRILIGKF